MIRLLKEETFTEGKKYIEAAGLSTDSKPMGVITGSVFVEVDTGDAYLYDETGNGTWDKVGGA